LKKNGAIQKALKAKLLIPFGLKLQNDQVFTTLDLECIRKTFLNIFSKKFLKKWDAYFEGKFSEIF